MSFSPATCNSCYHWNHGQIPIFHNSGPVLPFPASGWQGTDTNMQLGFLRREIERLDQSHRESMQRDQAKFEELGNKLGESKRQCSDLEATNEKQAEEIAGLRSNMEELSNTNVEIKEALGHLQQQVSFIVESADTIALPKKVHSSKAKRDGATAGANLNGAAEGNQGAKKRPINERLGLPVRPAHTKQSLKSVNERLNFPPQAEPEARPARGRDAGHQQWTKRTNFSTHNRFEVLRMEDRGDPMELAVTFRNLERNPNLAELRDKVTQKLREASNSTDIRAEKFHLCGTATAYLRIRVPEEARRCVSAKGSAQLAGGSGGNHLSIAWRRWLPKAGTLPAQQPVRMNKEQEASQAQGEHPPQQTVCRSASQHTDFGNEDLRDIVPMLAEALECTPSPTAQPRSMPGPKPPVTANGQNQEGTKVTRPQTRAFLAASAELQPSTGLQAQNEQSAAGQSRQESDRTTIGKRKHKTPAATQATHEQETVHTTTDLTAGGGGEARQTRGARGYSTTFQPRTLNKDQHDFHRGYWKASAKGACHALAQEGKKAVETKYDGNCWVAGTYQSMHPTVTYPELDNKAIEMRSSAVVFLKENRNAFDWTKNQQVYEETLRAIEENYAWGNDHTLEVLAKQHGLTISIRNALDGDFLQKVGAGDKEIELLLRQDGTTPIYGPDEQPMRDGNTGAVLMAGGHYWAVVPADSRAGRSSESGGGAGGSPSGGGPEN